jgi:CDP-glucose 4,6-dehydratase
VRPWEHVLEPLGGYLRLAERLAASETFAGAWNFGPRDDDAVAVETVVELITGHWEGARWESKPERDAPHEAGLLRLDWSKARTRLGWHPGLTLKEAVELTVSWYRAAAGTASARAMYELSVEQIRHYQTRWQSARES